MILLWDALDLRRLRQLRDPRFPSPVTALCFTDGATVLLAGSEDGHVVGWTTARPGRKLPSLHGQSMNPSVLTSLRAEAGAVPGPVPQL